MELINLIHKELPQIQCGRCDTPGCKQYAEAIAQGSPHDRCVPGGKETLNKLNDITAMQYEDVNDDYGPSIPNQKVKIIEEKIRDKIPTIPSTIKDEVQTNIFLRYDDLDVKNTLNLKKATDLEVFTKLRDLKDNF